MILCLNLIENLPDSSLFVQIMTFKILFLIFIELFLHLKGIVNLLKLKSNV